jgi:hypothetical protein
MNGPMCYSQVFLLRCRGSPAKTELHKASCGGNPEIAKVPVDFQFSDLTAGAFEFLKIPQVTTGSPHPLETEALENRPLPKNIGNCLGRIPSGSNGSFNSPHF